MANRTLHPVTVSVRAMPRPVTPVRILLVVLVSVTGRVWGDDNEIPGEIIPFIEPNTKVLSVEKADLNGDSREDYLVVLEKAKSDPESPNDYDRPLIILVRTKASTLRLAARNDKLVRCEACGGMQGDPFQGVDIMGQSFKVGAFGGSGRYHWTEAFKFAYSKRDRTWQLVEASGEFRDTQDENDDGKAWVATPPKD